MEDIPLVTELLSLRMELTRGVLCDLFICPALVGEGFFTFNSVDLVIGLSLVFFSSLFLDNLPALSSAADINSKTFVEHLISLNPIAQRIITRSVLPQSLLQVRGIIIIVSLKINVLGVVWRCLIQRKEESLGSVTHLLAFVSLMIRMSLGST